MIAAEYYQKNKTQMNARMKEWRLNNPNYAKEYRHKNKEENNKKGNRYESK